MGQLAKSLSPAMMLYNAAKGKSSSTAGLALPQSTKGPLGGPGMPAMPGQSPLGMSLSAPPGNSLAASQGQRSPLG